jgi:pimeloyl-ACP methyl ester carboxylesterase
MALIIRDVGQGAPLVFLHAFPLTFRMWLPQQQAFAQNYRVVMPMTRGFGGSPLPKEPPTMQSYADDLRHILDARRIERCTLIGLSMGGYIAFAFLRQHADRVERLVLADTRPQPDTPEGRAARFVNAELVEKQGVAMLVNKLLPGLVAPTATEEVRQQVRQLAAENRQSGVAAALRAMADREDATTLLPTLTMPTLVITGSADALTPPAVGREMAAALPNARFVEIAGAGHLSNLEAPEAFNHALTTFLHEGDPAE